MATLDLNKCFPMGEDGTQGPLPKQSEFFNEVLNPKGSKFVAYYGGYGSGKSLILCITMIAQGVTFGGEYVIAREYMPELRRTTMKLFLELLPKELLVAHRVADAEIHIRSASGKPAVFYFVGLDDPGKLDSLTLSGAAIDEASQSSEEAFLKLQGRLRNSVGLRKMILVGNPKGHDWVFRYFVKQDMFTQDWQKKQYRMIKAPSTENRHLPPEYIETMLASYSKERIERDINGSFDSFEGQVYSEFQRDVHVIKPFRIPDEWPKHIRIDHGYRNPTSVGFYAIGPDGEVYKYREFYQAEYLIHETMNGNPKEKKIGITQMVPAHEKFETAKIDPSTKNRRGTSGESDYDEYRRHWPNSWPILGFAKNDVQVGIDRVKSYLKIHEKSKRPMLFLFDTCVNTIDEITQYRYEELKPNQAGNKAEKETPRKVNDHACFTLGTRVMTMQGERAIETIRPGDLVLTSLGYQSVLVSRSMGVQPIVVTVLSSGRTLSGTANHPILCSNGTIALSALTAFDTLVSIPIWLTKLPLMGLCLGKLVATTAQTVHTVNEVLSPYIGKFGSIITDLFRPLVTYTTKMVIPTTITLKTWNAFQPLHTYPNTLRYPKKDKPHTLPVYAHSLNSGTHPRLGANGIGNTLSRLQRKYIHTITKSIKRVLSALRPTLPTSLQRFDLNTVTLTAKPQPSGYAEVWNLAVSTVSEYYAEGVLVSNCDELRYMIVDLPEPYHKAEMPDKRFRESELAMQRMIAAAKLPKQSDPFGF